jgi:hypothetical protein
MEYNLKPREVFCIVCRTYRLSVDQHPNCPVCNRAMITVVRSMMDDTRLNEQIDGFLFDEEKNA